VESWTGEELRRAAIEVLGAHADERAHDALAHATLTISHGAARWEGSHGPVEGHHVTVGLDAARLGTLRATPALVDALLAAVAAAMATHLGEALLDVRLRWTRISEPTHSAYRDGPPLHGPPTLHEGLVAYLAAAGEAELARVVATGSLAETATGGATIELPRAARDALRSHPGGLAAIERGVRDLLGSERASVSLRTGANR
jgi:hypothetical protein